MKNFKIVFVHGYTASSKADWYPNLAPELEKLGIDFVVPDLPGGKNPHSKEWLKIIDKEVKSANKPVVLVGHSLGTRAVLLYLDKFGQKVDTVVLIAAFDNNYVANRSRRNECYSDFFDYALDIEKIKKLANKFIVIHSRNDSSIPYEQGERIAKYLNAELIFFEDRDHFVAPKNSSAILEILRKELNF